MVLDKKPQSRAAVGGFLLILVAVIVRGRRGRPDLRRLLASIFQQLRRSVPAWPPAPAVLIRHGGVAAVLSVALLAGSGLCGAASSEEDDEGRLWVAEARVKHQKVLGDLLKTLPIERLCAFVPTLRLLVHSDRLAFPISASGGAASDGDDNFDFGVTAETISEVSEKLVKVDRMSSLAWEGYAIAAALSAAEIEKALRDLGTAPPLSRNLSVNEDSSLQTSVAELETLRQKVANAEELSEQLWKQCPTWKAAKSITALYEKQLRSAAQSMRERRAAQWRCVAKLLWRFRNTLPFIALSSVVSVFLGAFSSLRLHYQAAIINLAKDAVTNKPTYGVGEAVGAIVVSELITQIAEFGRARLAARGKTRVVNHLKVALFEALLRQDLEYLEQADLWHLRMLIGSCGSTVGQVIDFPAVFTEVVIRVATSLVILWGKSRELTGFVLVALPLRVALSSLVDRVGDGFEQRTCLPDFRGQINDCWSGLVRPASLRTMRAFAREPLESTTFARFIEAQDRLQERGQIIYRFLEPIRTFLEHGTEIGALWYGGRLALQGKIEFGDLSSFVLVAQNAFDGMRYVHAAASNVSTHALGPLTQMVSLLSQRPRIGLDDPPLEAMPDPASMRWRIEFQNVSFFYPQRPGAMVLKGLSFVAREGEFLGILGTTGAGKSTVFALLLRFYEPTEGQILLDGRDICEYNPLWLRRQVGFVSQELVLCQRTVHENLVYGLVEGRSAQQAPPDEEARAALRIAQCEDTFFDAATFPNLWHTDVGDGGSDLSGGQRQRLGIARSVLKKPRLMLLDEATSALDELSQAALQSALDELRASGMTTLCIAHRLSNLAKSDRLVVLADGKVAEEGTPADLLQRPGGIYAEYAKAHRESMPGADSEVARRS